MFTKTQTSKFDIWIISKRILIIFLRTWTFKRNSLLTKYNLIALQLDNFCHLIKFLGDLELGLVNFSKRGIVGVHHRVL